MTWLGKRVARLENEREPDGVRVIISRGGAEDNGKLHEYSSALTVIINKPECDYEE